MGTVPVVASGLAIAALAFHKVGGVRAVVLFTSLPPPPVRSLRGLVPRRSHCARFAGFVAVATHQVSDG